MADEDIEVTETGPESEQTPEPKGPSLEQQLEQMKQERDSAHARAAEAERRAQEAGSQAARAAEEVRKNELLYMGGSIEMLDQQREQLEAQYANAMAEGDFAKAGKLNTEITTNVISRRDIERGKLLAEAKPAAAPPPRAADPVEQFAATLHPKSAAWVRAHPEYARDPKKFEALGAAHKLALTVGGFNDETGGAPMPDSYYAFMERALGIEGGAAIPRATSESADEGVDVVVSDAAKPVQTRQAATQRDVQPSPAPASRGGNARTVRLDRDMIEAARISNMDPQEYARIMLAEKAKGTIGRGSRGNTH